eukprot:TRINITY_DN2779_c0_g2_i1.p1 TRINITY_DN2779_c0_g2~~TRINITY_DN2779_c0_g2_i1.p1  ORF type:complete len:1166 (+),score=364.22 TRINITY_DN2779_c0_g2_i1:55-3552(+)
MAAAHSAKRRSRTAGDPPTSSVPVRSRTTDDVVGRLSAKRAGSRARTAGFAPPSHPPPLGRALRQSFSRSSTYAHATPTPAPAPRVRHSTTSVSSAVAARRRAPSVVARGRLSASRLGRGTANGNTAAEFTELSPAALAAQAQARRQPHAAAARTPSAPPGDVSPTVSRSSSPARASSVSSAVLPPPRSKAPDQLRPEEAPRPYSPATGRAYSGARTPAPCHGTSSSPASSRFGAHRSSGNLTVALDAVTALQTLEREVALLDDIVTLETSRADDEEHRGNQARDELLQARQRLRKVQKECDQLAERAEKAEAVAEQRLAQIHDLEEQLTGAARVRRAADAKAALLAEREASVEQQEADLAEERAQIEGLIAGRARQREGSIMKRRSMEEELATLKADCARNKTEAVAARWRLAAVRATSPPSAHDIASQQQRMHEDRAEIISLKARLAASEEARAEAERECEQLQQRLEELTARVAEMRRAGEDLDAARDTLAAALAERREVGMERDAVEAARRQLEEEWDSGSQVVDELLAAARREAALAEKVERLQRRVDELEETLEHAQGSTQSAAAAAAAAVGRWRQRRASSPPCHAPTSPTSTSEASRAVDSPPGFGATDRVCKEWSAMRPQNTRTQLPGIRLLVMSRAEHRHDAAESPAVKIGCLYFAQAAVASSKKEVRLIHAKLTCAEARCREAEGQARLLFQRSPHEPRTSWRRSSVQPPLHTPVMNPIEPASSSSQTGPAVHTTMGTQPQLLLSGPTEIEMRLAAAQREIDRLREENEDVMAQCERLQRRASAADRDGHSVSRLSAALEDARTESATALARHSAEVRQLRDELGRCAEREQQQRRASAHDAAELAALRVRVRRQQGPALQNGLLGELGEVVRRSIADAAAEAAALERERTHAKTRRAICGQQGWRCADDRARGRVLRRVCEALLGIIAAVGPPSPALRAVTMQLAAAIAGPGHGSPPRSLRAAPARASRQPDRRTERDGSQFALSPARLTLSPSPRRADPSLLRVPSPPPPPSTPPHADPAPVPRWRATRGPDPDTACLADSAGRSGAEGCMEAVAGPTSESPSPASAPSEPPPPPTTEELSAPSPAPDALFAASSAGLAAAAVAATVPPPAELSAPSGAPAADALSAASSAGLAAAAVAATVPPEKSDACTVQ